MSRRRGQFQKIKKKHQAPVRSEKWHWKSCRSKTPFKEFAAKAKAEEFGQRAYFCDLCEMWHLTSITAPFRERAE